jgi:hypothetical protein
MVVYRIVLSVVLSLAVALVPHGSAAHSSNAAEAADATRTATATQAARSLEQRATGNLPTRGILVVGKSLAGVRLGQTQAKVKKLWGGNYILCVKAPCKDPTWLYFYHSGEPLGAAVRFRNKRVIAVFTLGAVPGWKSADGVKIADPASKVYDLYGNPTYSKCIGFESLSVPRKGSVTSFYLTSGVIYGFALTIPKLTVCQ